MRRKPEGHSSAVAEPPGGSQPEGQSAEGGDKHWKMLAVLLISRIKPTLYRVGSKDLDVTRGGWGMLMSTLTRQGAKVVSGIGAARKDEGLPPDDQLSTADWVAKFSKNEAVHGVFRNMCASVFSVGSVVESLNIVVSEPAPTHRRPLGKGSGRSCSSGSPRCLPKS